MSKLMSADIICMKKSLPSTIYKEYLLNALEASDYFWIELLHCLGYCENKIIDWDFDRLTLEQRLLLQHYPYRMPSFAAEYVHILKISFDTTFKKNICMECAKNKCAVGETLNRNIFTQHISAYKIAEFMRNTEQWCNACQQQPLFRMSNGTNDMFYKVFNLSLYDISLFIGNKFNNSLGLSTKVVKNKDNTFV